MKARKQRIYCRHIKKVTDERLRLLIYGSIPEDMKGILLPLIESDQRIRFLGWKRSDEQEVILGATDLYIQPGTYSATAQVALCAGCALIVNNGYKRAMGDAVLYEEDEEGIEKVLKAVTSIDCYLETIKGKGFQFAMNNCDYCKLSMRYLQ